MKDQGYANPLIAARQRKIVELQLKSMREGHPPSEYSIVGEFLRQIPLEPPISLLDVGCGSAYYSEVVEHFAPGFYHYMGVDFNPGMVELAHRLYPKLEVVQMDARSLKLWNYYIEVVLSGACIIHMEGWKKALAELIRVAKIYLILHRNPIWLDQSPTIYSDHLAYGVGVKIYRFNEDELLGQILEDFELVDSRDVCPASQTRVTRSYLFERRKDR